MKSVVVDAGGVSQNIHVAAGLSVWTDVIARGIAVILAINRLVNAHVVVVRAISALATKLVHSTLIRTVTALERVKTSITRWNALAQIGNARIVKVSIEIDTRVAAIRTVVQMESTLTVVVGSAVEISPLRREYEIKPPLRCRRALFIPTQARAARLWIAHAVFVGVLASAHVKFYAHFIDFNVHSRFHWNRARIAGSPTTIARRL